MERLLGVGCVREVDRSWFWLWQLDMVGDGRGSRLAIAADQEFIDAVIAAGLTDEVRHWLGCAPEVAVCVRDGAGFRLRSEAQYQWLRSLPVRLDVAPETLGLLVWWMLLLEEPGDRAGWAAGVWPFLWMWRSTHHVLARFGDEQLRLVVAGFEGELSGATWDVFVAGAGDRVVWARLAARRDCPLVLLDRWAGSGWRWVRCNALSTRGRRRVRSGFGSLSVRLVVAGLGDVVEGFLGRFCSVASPDFADL